MNHNKNNILKLIIVNIMLCINVMAINNNGRFSAITGDVQEGGTISAILTEEDGYNTIVKFELLDGSDNVLETEMIDGIGTIATVSFTLAADQSLVGQQLKIRASYIDGDGVESSTPIMLDEFISPIIVSTAVANVDDVGIFADISGDIEEGGTISTTLTDEDGLDEVVVTFELLRRGRVVETKTATGSDTTADVSFDLADDHSLVGQQLKIRASYTDNFGTVYEVTPAPGQSSAPISAFSTAVANVDDAGLLHAQKTKERGIIRASLLDHEGLDRVDITFELLDENDIVLYTEIDSGRGIAGGTRFTLTNDQILADQQLRVRVSYTDRAGTVYAVEPMPGQLPALIQQVSADISFLGFLYPIIEPEEGGIILTALLDIDGIDGINVKFDLLNENGDILQTQLIMGSNLKAVVSFVLEDDQSLVGQQLRVRASYTDRAGTVYAVEPMPGQLPAIITAVSAAVSNVDDAGVFADISGDIEEGGTISTTLTDLDGIDGVDVTFELLDESGDVVETRTDSDSVRAKIITGSGTTAAVSFTLANDESLVGQQLKIRASYTDEENTVYAVTPAPGQLLARTTIDSAVVANVNDAPTAVMLSRPSLTLVTSVSITNSLRLSDVSIIDSDAGNNVLILSGSGSDDFNVLKTPNGNYILRLNPRVDLSVDKQDVYIITISVSDSSIADSIPVTATFTLKVINNPVISLLDDSKNIFSKTQKPKLRAFASSLGIPTASFSDKDEDVIKKLDAISKKSELQEGDAEYIAKVASELAPETHTTIGVGIESVVGSVSSSLGNRNTPSGLSNLNGPEAQEFSNNIRKGAFWYDFNYNNGDRDSNGNVSGYDYNGYTIQLGYERLYGETFLGASFSYGDTNIDNSNNAGDAEITTLSLGAYGNYQKDDTFFTGTFILAFSDVESTRTRSVLGNLSGETSALSYDLELIYGKIYKKSNLTLTSLTGLRYSNSNIDDINEKGSSSGTSTSSQSYDSLYLKFGGIANWILVKDSVAKTEQSLSLIINYDINLLDLERNVSSQFTSGGDKFETAGVDQSRGSLTFGTNYQYVNKAVIYELGYNYRFSSISSSNNLSVKIKHNF